MVTSSTCRYRRGGDDEYWAVFQATVPALIEQAKPDIVIISGFDGHLMI